MNDLLTALKILADRCDGARSIDGSGFNKFDAGFGKSLAQRSFLTEKQIAAAKTLILKYQNQLDPDLVERVRSFVPAFSVPSTPSSSLSPQEVLDKLSWSYPKIVKGGTLKLETAYQTDEFRAAYRANKQFFVDRGITVKPNRNGVWEVLRWTKLKEEPEEPKLQFKEEEVDIDTEILTNLLDYQPPSVKKLVNAINFYNAGFDGSDCGSGKTWVALATAKTLGYRAFVVCPKHGIPNWERTGQALGVTVEALNYELVKRGNTKWGKWNKRVEFDKDGKPKTIEEFEWLVPPVYLMIFDECHRAKALNSINSEIVIAAKKQNYPMLLLSATAAANPLEMRAIGYSLGLFDIKNYWKWAMQHGVKKGRWGMEFVGGIAELTRIHESIFKEGRGTRIRIADIPNFPDVGEGASTKLF